MIELNALLDELVMMAKSQPTAFDVLKSANAEALALAPVVAPAVPEEKATEDKTELAEPETETAVAEPEPVVVDEPEAEEPEVAEVVEPEVKAEPEAPMSKAVPVTREDGSVAMAVEASDALAALQIELDARRAEGEMVVKALSSTTDLIKSMNAQMVTQAEALTSQGSLIKALRGEVARLGATGTGRRSALSIHEKPSTTVAEPAPTGPSYADVMAKAQTLQRQGQLGGADVARIVSYANRGLGIPDDLTKHFAS